MERSALPPPMPVIAVELLFPGLESVDVLLTVAVLEIVVPAGSDTSLVTTSVTVADPPLMTVPSEQVTGDAALHVPCDGVAETNVVFAGIVSETVTLAASDGPLFETVTV